MDGVKKILRKLNIQFEENVSGARLTSFCVGGGVALVIKPRSIEQMRDALTLLEENEVGYHLLGRGSNVVISDAGYGGAIVLTSLLNDIISDGNALIAGAGATLRALAVEAQKNSLTGLEFAHGIPGSVGGGIYMNAGAYGGEISKALSSCECYDVKNGVFLKLNSQDCDFSYRHSVFQERRELAVLSARFELERGDGDAILEKMNDLRASRLSKQPLEYPSAGSTFKRPKDNFAGKLIEDAGLKGYCVGGACVSEKHAGFVINKGGATVSDVAGLIEHIRKEVNDKFGVLLECEIEFIE